MYYARTTFVPPLTDEEMEKVFYPMPRINSPESEIRHPPAPEKLPSVPKEEFNNSFNYLFTNQHLMDKLDKNLISYYDTSLDDYLYFTGQQILELVQKYFSCQSNIYFFRLIYLFGNGNKFPQEYHSILLVNGLSNQLLSSMRNNYY